MTVYKLRFITLALALCCSGVQASEFKIATLAPEGTSWLKEIRSAAEKLEQETQGRVSFKFYPAGVMGNDQTVLRKIRLRQLQGAALTAGALSQFEPSTGLYSLPMLFNSIAEVRHVREHVDPQLKLRLKAKGLVALGISDGGFAYLMSDKPVLDLDGMGEYKVWLPEGDTVTATVFLTAGLRPVSLSLADVYTGLQTGLIDTIASTTTGAIAFQWHTRVNHMADFPLVYLSGYFVVNAGTFAKLSAKDQRLMETVFAKSFRTLDDVNQQDNTAARVALQSNGMKIQTLSDEQSQRWRQLADMTVEKVKSRDNFDNTLFDMINWRLASYRSQVKQSVSQ